MQFCLKKYYVFLLVQSLLPCYIPHELVCPAPAIEAAILIVHLTQLQKYTVDILHHGISRLCQHFAYAIGGHFIVAEYALIRADYILLSL